jgi:hypothetical protein
MAIPQEIKPLTVGNPIIVQNNPNPFEETTDIVFETFENGKVNVVVYDQFGKEIAVLVNETLPAGKHHATWNSSDLPAGIYMYRIESDKQHETRIMTKVE